MKYQHVNIQSALKQNKLFPASYSQASMYFIHKLDPDGIGYNIMFAAKIKATIDTKALRAAVAHLVRKNTALRTVFFDAGGKIFQKLLTDNFFQFDEFDVFDMSAPEIEAGMEDYGHIPYDLQRGPLIRVGLFKHGDGESFIVIGMHHITCDAGSFDTIFNDLQHFYSLEMKGEQPHYLAFATYNKFVKWEKEWLKSDQAQKSKKYWHDVLKKPMNRLDLKRLCKVGDALSNFEPKRPSTFDFEGGELFYTFDEDLTQKLKQFAKNERVTLYTVLLGAYFILLNKLTGATNVSVGAYANLRHRPEFYKQVGYYLNTIVLRSEVHQDVPLRSFINQTKDVLLGALAHQYYPFSLLAEELNPAREPGRQLWFDHILNWTAGKEYEMSNAFFMEQLGKAQKIYSLPMEPYKINRRTAPFDFALNMGELSNQIVCSIFFNAQLFSKESAFVMMERFKNILSQIVNKSIGQIRHIKLLDESEEKSLLEKSAGAIVGYDEEETLYGAFSKQAEKTPAAKAIYFHDLTLSYADLKARVEKIAKELIDAGVKQGVGVGVCMQRSPQMIAVLLAVLKAGGHYVPLDPAYPLARNAYILEDSGAALLLMSEGFSDLCPQSRIPVAFLKADDSLFYLNKTTASTKGLKIDNLAYLIYTSGSTGNPKGAKVSHKNCMALFCWADDVFSKEEISGVLGSTSICFDISVFEIFYPLIRGGAVILVKDILHYMDDQNKNKVSLINTVPSLMSAFLENADLGETITTVTLVGEPLRRSLCDKLYSYKNVKKVYNLYGPTEDTVFSTYALVPKGGKDEPTIGKPIHNTIAYILDENLNLQPPYIPGELYLAGDGVIPGYHNRDVLNNKAFIQDPFQGGAARMYKTGDIASYLPTGEIEYVGREDKQVKIRGYRIELGEIENHLIQLDSISDAVVLALLPENQSERILVAYIVSSNIPFQGAQDSIVDFDAQKKIIEELSKNIPKHLAPSQFVFVKSMPKTLNGKIDRRGLEKIPLGLPAADKRNAFSSKTETQKIMSEIWGEILNIPPESIDVRDKFYDLGGSSLKLVQVVRYIQARFNVKISIVDLFRFQDMASISRWLDGGEGPNSIVSAGVLQGQARRARLKALTGNRRKIV